MKSRRQTTNGTARWRVENEGPAQPLIWAGPLESLRKGWLDQELATTSESDLHLLLRRASDEAAAVAWASLFPHLTLPELLAEKGRAARQQFQKQQDINKRQQLKMSFAA